MSERTLTAYHEAAHAVVALLLDARVEFVSIRPGKQHAGITWTDGLPTWSSDAALAAELPTPLIAADIRRAMEVRMCISLAGDAAAILAPVTSGYIAPTPDQPAAERLARTLEDLSPRHAELLRAAEERTDPIHTDADLAERAALGSGAEIHAHVAYMRTVVARMVDEHVPEIAAVAAELERREVLTGDEVRAAMRSARPPIRKEKP